MQAALLSGFLAREAASLAWLRQSGIQVDGGTDAGGVYAWLDESSGKPAYLYSEITGYFMTLCVQLARINPGEGWRERAEAAARFIVDVAQDPSGAILCRKYPQGEGTDDPYSFAKRSTLFFDCAMVGYGLLNTFALTGNRRWLDAAKRLGEFCLEHFLPTNAWQWGYDLEGGAPLPWASRWSQHFGAFESKGLMFFAALARHSGEGHYSDIANNLVDAALGSQRPDGRFPTTHPHGETTHLHPHSYTVEGLLWAAAHLGRVDALEPCGRALAWSLERCLSQTPPLHQWSEDPSLCFTELRSDTLAQTLRAEVIHSRLIGRAPPPRPELWQRLDAFRLPSGGTSYGRDENGPRPHANAWCHFFALEARLFAAAPNIQPDVLIIT